MAAETPVGTLKTSAPPALPRIARGLKPYRDLNSALKRRTLPKPLANAISVWLSEVSRSSRLANSNRCVCANSIGDTPSSDCVTRRRCRSLTPSDAASSPHARSTAHAPRCRQWRRPPSDHRIHGRKTRGSFRPAAKAWPETCALGGCGAGVEAHILPLRRSDRAYGSAVDAGRGHRNIKASVEARVAGPHCAITSV